MQIIDHPLLYPAFERECRFLQSSYPELTHKYNQTRKLGREYVAKEIISYDMAQKDKRKAIRKEKNKEFCKSYGGVFFCVALAVGGVIYKYLSASSN